MADRFPKFTDDVEVISKLGDTPGTDDNLTTDQLKARFDQAPKAIKEYLISLVETLEKQFGGDGGAVAGGNLTSGLNMNYYPLTGLRTPTDILDAANKGYVDAAVKAVREDMQAQKLVFSDITVPASAFAADSTYPDYPYRAAVALTGVLERMIPEVVFSVSTLADTGFAPVAQCYDGGVYIWADGIPSGDVAIHTILCWKGAGA